jgi:hypothetical protein
MKKKYLAMGVVVFLVVLVAAPQVVGATIILAGAVGGIITGIAPHLSRL